MVYGLRGRQRLQGRTKRSEQICDWSRTTAWRRVQVVMNAAEIEGGPHKCPKGLRRLGGAPQEHRTDSLAAAFKNLKVEDRDDLTRRYEALCAHYGMRPSRNNRGQGHENGAIESPHGHLKKVIVQGLLMRGSHDSDSVASYQHWLQNLVDKQNRRCQAKLEEERPRLRSLPPGQTADYTELFVRVTSSSTINVRLMVYTVPSRLIGERLRVHLYDDRLHCYLATEHVLTLPRAYASKDKRRGRRVDYCHVIGSLKKKPMAFYRSQLRNDLLPTPTLPTDLEPTGCTTVRAGRLQAHGGSLGSGGGARPSRRSAHLGRAPAALWRAAYGTALLRPCAA